MNIECLNESGILSRNSGFLLEGIVMRSFILYFLMAGIILLICVMGGGF